MAPAVMFQLHLRDKSTIDHSLGCCSSMRVFASLFLWRVSFGARHGNGGTGPALTSSLRLATNQQASQFGAILAPGTKQLPSPHLNLPHCIGKSDVLTFRPHNVSSYSIPLPLTVSTLLHTRWHCQSFPDVQLLAHCSFHLVVHSAPSRTYLSLPPVLLHHLRPAAMHSKMRSTQKHLASTGAKTRSETFTIRLLWSWPSSPALCTAVSTHPQQSKCAHS